MIWSYPLVPPVLLPAADAAPRKQGPMPAQGRLPVLGSANYRKPPNRIIASTQSGSQYSRRDQVWGAAARVRDWRRLVKDSDSTLHATFANSCVVT